MSYIGRTPTVGNFQICDAISTVNNQAAYTMQVGSVNVIPETANHMIVSLNGVIQAPISSFTVSGSTITFAANLVTGDVINFIQILGDVLDLGVPSDGTVTSAKIANDAVTLAKMAAGTDGNIISYDASGNPVAIATGNDGQVLTSTGAGSPPAFEALPSGGITMASQWRLTTSFTGDASPIASNWEQNDGSDPAVSYYGSQMTESSGVFTFPSTGIYYVELLVGYYINGDSGFNHSLIKAATNGSTFNTMTECTTFITGNSSANTWSSTTGSIIIDVRSTSEDVVRFDIDVDSAGTTIVGNGTRDITAVRFIRLANT